MGRVEIWEEKSGTAKVGVGICGRVEGSVSDVFPYVFEGSGGS